MYCTDDRWGGKGKKKGGGKDCDEESIYEYVSEANMFNETIVIIDIISVTNICF